ncbi:MAG: polysaccharide biosynthesis C-terminal domain-containing protein [Deltaproteobacteria bacterium]|nr:polysaccharide biosynthesis C-terminal domain-containing protein [Deltaproteobacteria bacterium]
MNLVRATSITVVTKLLATATAALAAIVVAGALGATGAGTFALVRVLPGTIAAVLGAGMTIANPYLIGSRRYSVQAITETTVALGLGLGVVGCAGWWAAGNLLHAHFYSTLSARDALLVGLAIPMNLLRDYLNSVQQGLRSFKAANLVLLTDDVVSLALLLPLLAGVGGTTLVVVAAVAGPVASVLLAAAMLLRRGIRPWPRVHPALARDAMRFGIKGHVGRMANMLNWRLDVMILATLASVEVVGCYSVASKVAELFRPLSASLTFVLRPLIAGLSAVEARVRGVFLYRRVFLINLAAILVLAAVGERLILAFFGAEFAPAVPALYILLVGLAAHGADGVLSGYNVGIGRPELNTYTALAGLVVTVIGDLTLIPAYGLVGAAVASSAAYTVKAVAFTGLFLATADVSLPQLVGWKEYGPDLA